MKTETKPHPNAEILRAIADGKSVRYVSKDGPVALSAEDAMRHLLNNGAAHLKVQPDPIRRFIPVHRMPAGSLVMAEAKTDRRYAIDDTYNGRGKSEKQVGVLCVEIDPDTLELVSASVEKL